MKKKIAVLAGDGIGPEVMRHTLRVLDAIASRFQHQFEYCHGKIGGAAYDMYQSHCPSETLQLCRNADAILFGSVGGPLAEQHLAKWQHCETNSILELRRVFNFNVNLRPIKIYPALIDASPLKNELIYHGIDIAIFRELSGDLYFGEHTQAQLENKRIASDVAHYHEDQISAIAHAAFKAAAKRRGKVVSVDKANVLATSKLWRDIVTAVSQHYPKVQLTHLLVDNAAMQLVLDPSQFDVVVTSNMFGDILSDLAAALTGSVGLIPSASLNNESFGLYEPAGGSAPDIAGKDRANPVAQMMSAALLLQYSFQLTTEANLIESAVQHTLAAGTRTPDLAGKHTAVGTAEFTDAIIQYILDAALS